MNTPRTAPKLYLEGIAGDHFSAASVREWLTMHDGEPVTIHINSPGGNAFEGVAIYRTLKANTGKVTTVCSAIAASAASVIFLAGSERVMPTGSMLMIHNPAAVTIGPAQAHEHAADTLRQVGDAIAEIYAEATGQSKQWILARMEEETWFDGAEAVTRGFATKAGGEQSSEPVAFNYSIFNHAPAWLLQRAQSEGADMSKPNTTTTPAAVTPPADPPAADATLAIVNLCFDVNLTAQETRDVIEKANGSLDKAKDLVINMQADRDPQPQSRAAIVNENTYDNPGFTANAKAAAIYARLSGTEPAEHARPFAAMSLGELANGGKKWLGRAPEISNSGMHTTSDFQTALGSAMNRRLLEAMKAADTGITELAAPSTVNDFRAHQEVQMSSFPSLEKVPESGDITYGTLQENGETYRIDSYARAITISFQALVNDDLGAINRAIRDTAFGAVERKAKLLIAALSAKLADGKALFHADHANLAGAGATISQTTLSAARLAMRTQKALDGATPLGITPRVLLVPAALETDADAIVAAIQPATVDDVNVFAGKLRVAVEARLTGNPWYLFADPAMHPVLKFATLAGFENPRFEVNEEFNRLGTSYRVHWHVGAAPIDFRGAYKNPGS